MKKNCPYCFKEIDKHEEVCPYCNAQLVEKRTNRVTFLSLWKQLTLFAIGLFGLQIISLLIQLIVSFFYGTTHNKDELIAFSQSVEFSAILNFSIYVILFAILVLILFKDNIRLLKTFKNWVVPVAAIIGYISILAFNYFYSFVLNVSGLSISNNANESGITSIVKAYPLLSVIIFGVIGPVCEEITYRIGLYSSLRRVNKYLAYIVTILVFAFIHFDFASLTSTNSTLIINEFLNMPYYVFAAFTFCFLYEKYGFAASLSAHITNNLVSVLSTIILIASQQ